MILMCLCLSKQQNSSMHGIAETWEIQNETQRHLRDKWYVICGRNLFLFGNMMRKQHECHFSNHAKLPGWLSSHYPCNQIKNFQNQVVPICGLLIIAYLDYSNNTFCLD